MILLAKPASEESLAVKQGDKRWIFIPAPYTQVQADILIPSATADYHFWHLFLFFAPIFWN